MTTVDRIAYAILKSIETKHLKEGEILPTERDLAKKYSVNRSTIREALKMLETFRYISKLSGVGTIVLPQTQWSFESFIFKYTFAKRIEPSTASDFVSLLITIEQAAANIAFNKKTSKDVNLINQLYSELLMSEDPSEQDCQIHMHFALLSGNAVYVRILNALWIPIKKYSFLYHTSKYGERAKKLLKNIVVPFRNNKRQFISSISIYYHDALSILLKGLSASD